jgi:hypothetical protein
VRDCGTGEVVFLLIGIGVAAGLVAWTLASFLP